MSELYEVTVEEVDGARVALRVITVHPDAGPPPPQPTFAINLLIDLWSLLFNGYVVLISGVKLSKSEATALAGASSCAQVMRHLRDLSRGIDAPVSASEYESLARGGPMPERFAGMRSVGLVIHDGQHCVTLAGERAAFDAACADLVVRCVHDDHHHQEVYQQWLDALESDAPEESEEPGGGEMPSVRVVVTLREPALLGFVKSGMTFGTASYF